MTLEVQNIQKSLSILEIATQYTPWSWEAVFKGATDELELISNIQKEIGPYYPRPQDLFRAFHWTPLHKVKMVMVSAEPYAEQGEHGRPRAQGASLTVAKDDVKPSILSNIFEELREEYVTYVIPLHGDLREWAFQGVLLLELKLTITPGMPKSPNRMWTSFIDKIVRALPKDCIYLLMGGDTQEIKELLPPKAIIIETGHPNMKKSTNSAKKRDIVDFRGSGVFKKINAVLLEKGLGEINWQISRE